MKNVAATEISGLRLVTLEMKRTSLKREKVQVNSYQT